MDSLIPRGDLYREGSSQFLLNTEEKRLTLANRVYTYKDSSWNNMWWYYILHRTALTDEFTITNLQEAILCHCIQPPKTRTLKGDNFSFILIQNYSDVPGHWSIPLHIVYLSHAINWMICYSMILVYNFCSQITLIWKFLKGIQYLNSWSISFSNAF